MDHLRATLSTSRVVLVGALLAAACAQPEASPLSSLGIVARAEVTYAIPGDGPSHQTIADSGRLAVLRAAARRAGDWHSVLDTPPAGVARASFYRDSIFLGVLSVGPDFVGASDGSKTRFRKLNDAEGESVYVAIGLPTKPKP